MVYCYKKSDKEFKNPIFLADAVRYKSLWNKSEKIERELRDYFMTNNIMFECEDEDTKQEIYKAIDCLKSFRDNLKLKDCMRTK